jgi:hypothetical protein
MHTMRRSRDLLQRCTCREELGDRVAGSGQEYAPGMIPNRDVDLISVRDSRRKVRKPRLYVGPDSAVSTPEFGLQTTAPFVDEEWDAFCSCYEAEQRTFPPSLSLQLLIAILANFLTVFSTQRSHWKLRIECIAAGKG